jgi:hypothetical protein
MCTCDIAWLLGLTGGLVAGGLLALGFVLLVRYSPFRD